MSQRGTSRPTPADEYAKAGTIIALVLTNLVLIPFVLMMAANVVDDVKNRFDAEVIDPKAQTAIRAVISFTLFPLLLYLVYFIDFGKTTRQTRVAGWSVALIVTACLGNLAYTLKPRWPGGLPDLEMVLDALLTAFFCGWLLFGTIFRWRIIVRSKKRRSCRCQVCGYSLTGLTVARCPECGSPFDPNLLAKTAHCITLGSDRC
jgi:hypothetical protein